MGKQYRKEAMNQHLKLMQKKEAKMLGATFFAIAKLEEEQ